MFSLEKLKITLFASFVAFFTSVAPALASNGGSSLQMNLVMMVLIFVIFYFLIIRPQRNKNREHQKLVRSLKVGDHIMLNSGIIGKIIKLRDDYLDVAVCNDVFIVVARQAVAAVNPDFAVSDSLKTVSKASRKGAKAGQQAKKDS